MDIFKLVLSSVLSRKYAKYVTFDISNFYLQTPLDHPEYICIKISNIPQDFIDEYNLLYFVRDGWVYFEINHGVYSLPQLGILVNNLLKECLSKHRQYQCTNSPVLWIHKWRPILFRKIVNNFGVEYLCNCHAHHLRDSLKQHYDITENWKGDLYASINIKWDYTQRTCRLTMYNYIANLRLKWNHPDPKKRQLSPYKNTPIRYGAKIRYATEPPFSPLLDDKDIFRVQSIVSSLLYYA